MLETVFLIFAVAVIVAPLVLGFALMGLLTGVAFFGSLAMLGQSGIGLLFDETGIRKSHRRIGVGRRGMVPVGEEIPAA
jgi:hypothetical protein